MFQASGETGLKTLLFGFVAVLLAIPVQAADRDYTFESRSLDGASVSVSAEQSRITVVCFLGVECPLAKLYGPRLQSLSQKFGSQGVTFIGVNSNRQDSPAEIQQYAKAHDIKFPLIRDVQHQLADQFDAQRTPEVFVLNDQLQLAYRGRIDDQYEPGIVKAAVTTQHLRDAIQELLAGKPVTVAKTEAVGCMIGRGPRKADTSKIKDSTVTFSHGVARVLNQHCVECHRQGEIGPFALTDYDEVVGWADTLLEVIDDGRMPPWHADPQHDNLANARIMPEADKQVLRDWVALGAPLGDQSKVPPAPEFRDGWQLAREPDQIVAMRTKPFVVPAEGTVEYQYFVVDPGFKKDVWISGAQLIPGNRAVVHHAIAFIRPPDGAPIGRNGNIGWLTAYVPGQRLFPLPDSHARFVQAGSKFVFQMHYTPTGTEQSDLTRLGLVFADADRVTHEVFTIAGINQDFEIPPNAANHTVDAKVYFPRNGKLLGIAPHMHVRGKSFRLYGRTQSEDEAGLLLNVPKYDFNWQHNYMFTKPLELSELRELKFTVTFDNSSANPVNPNPNQHVTWGDQTWEEMAVAFFAISRPLKPSKNKTDSQPSVAATETSSAMDAKTQAREKAVDEFVARFLKKMDANNDQRVTRSEAPVAVRRFGTFGRIDRNRDDIISIEELRAVARENIRR